MTSIPVHLLTGFLGSGKSTLLNAALREPRLEGTAVLINELGEIAIDHDLVAEVADDMVVTTTGCMCCTASSDIGAALTELGRRRAAGEIRGFKRVIVETTGLADPAPIVNALTAGWQETPAGQPAFHLAGVTTLLDAILGEATLDAHFEALKQVALADAIVITKADLAVDPATRRDIERSRLRLADLNPAARQLDRRADWDAIVTRLTQSSSYDRAERSEDAVAWLDAEAILAHAHATDQMPERHGDGIRAHVLTVDEPLDPRGFYLFLEMLRLSAGPKILRLKGLFALADDPSRPLVVHGVQHVIHPVDRLDRWPSQDRRTRLVMIGHGLKAESIRRMLESLKPKAAAGASGDGRARESR